MAFPFCPFLFPTPFLVCAFLTDHPMASTHDDKEEDDEGNVPTTLSAKTVEYCGG